MEDRTWRDRLRGELAKLSKMTWRERFGYVWDYYKTQMAVLVAVILIANLAVTMIKNMRQEEVLQAYFVNCNAPGIDTEAMVSQFEEYIGGLGKNEVVTLDTTLTGGQEEVSQISAAGQMKFVALMSAHAMDLVLLDEPAYQEYRKEGFLMDLAPVLTDARRDKWKARLQEDKGAVYALDVTGAPVLEQYGVYQGQTVYAALIADALHAEMGLQFVEYLLEENGSGVQ